MHFLSLLPSEIVNIMIIQINSESNDSIHKKIFLITLQKNIPKKPFKWFPEKFRHTCESHKKEFGASWCVFAFELKNQKILKYSLLMI